MVITPFVFYSFYHWFSNSQLSSGETGSASTIPPPSQAKARLLDGRPAHSGSKTEKKERKPIGARRKNGLRKKTFFFLKKMLNLATHSVIKRK